jgi:hypothetical protein
LWAETLIAPSTVAVQNVVPVDPSERWWPIYLWRTTQRIFAFDLSNPRAPKLASGIELGEGKPWDVSPPVTADGRLFASHHVVGELRALDDGQNAKEDDTDGSESPGDDSQVNRHFLQVVDYANPAAPFIEDESPNVPGRLVGIARNGKILFTLGQQYNPDTGDAEPDKSVLHASAFDGMVVHLVDQLPLQSRWQPFVLKGELVFVFDGEEVVAGPGTFLLVPPDVPHSFHNRSDQAARFVNVHAPAGFDRRLAVD